MQKIAMIGKQCSGKTSVTKVIKSITPIPQVVKFADPIYSVLGALRKTKNRKFMQQFSDCAKEHFGGGIFAQIFEQKVLDIEKATPDGENLMPATVICDDVRYLIELRLCRKLDFKVIYISADTEIRQKRAAAQGLEFLEDHSSEREVGIMEDLADYIINNSDETKGALEADVARALNVLHIPLLN